MTRGFQIVSDFKEQGIRIPQRKTGFSAGYDLEAGETVIIPPKGTAKIPTGLKAYMMPDEALLVYARSSLFSARQCMLVNSVAVIDADYHDNPGNEGHILISLINMGDEPVTLRKGERFAQGVFTKYLKTDEDMPSESLRVGGYGSTGR
ncbi:MAG TPA: dUTP diphosphatase [Bacillota bacterium]|nr:dUTP diphosphatase [Bacillota bacterium]